LSGSPLPSWGSIFKSIS